MSFTQLSSDYFGVALVVGAMFEGLSCTANTFVGVGVSLERSDLIFIKSLPINLKGFLVQKYLVLVSLQASVPALAYLVISLFVLKLPLVLTLAFLVGMLAVIFLQGQWFYRKDVRLLDLKWQDVTQLFNRRYGQWLTMVSVFVTLIVGMLVFAATLYLGQLLNNVFLANSLVTLFLLAIGIINQFIIYRLFSDPLSNQSSFL